MSTKSHPKIGTTVKYNLGHKEQLKDAEKLWTGTVTAVFAIREECWCLVELDASYRGAPGIAHEWIAVPGQVKESTEEIMLLGVGTKVNCKLQPEGQLKDAEKLWTGTVTAVFGNSEGYWCLVELDASFRGASGIAREWIPLSTKS